MTQPPNDSGVVEAKPAWFAPVQEQIDRLEVKVNGLMTDFIELLIEDRKDRNSSSYTGITGPFREVPFRDGTKPWGAKVPGPGGPEVILPRLATAHDIANLTLLQSYAYFKGYYPDDELPNGVDAFPRSRAKSVASSQTRRLTGVGMPSPGADCNH
ncbi:uncharacterized protein ARMOST_19601 [Armillaria ostoyae]|uniref:Mug135-like C-terminal domain-containing protein n=1 Tax=Armillaria ostoyae TaxID=47428 RepID=A0A284S508_ARMOS|nr:uncharacterized protein ARMOST_19601 [Armillaria ostoyae]